VGIIVPAFNEEAALPRSVERLLAVLTDLAASGQVTTDSARQTQAVSARKP